MNVNSNGYTFGFAAVMVIVVAALLSVAATSLKPMQTRNVELETKQNILKSIGVTGTREEAEVAYSTYIKEEIVLQNGQVEEGVLASSIDLAKELSKPADQRQYPLFVADKEGETFYIIPVRGKGLWGPIWGYVALESDLQTIYGATFDHKTETPGLGAEIKEDFFTEKWEGNFRFAASANAVDLVVGSITGIAKKGWEYLWVRYREEEDTVAHALVMTPVAVYVEQVYLEADLNDLGI